MCIGNLRSGTQNLCDYIHTKEKKCLSKSILYYGVILCFIIGAVLGNVCISYMQEKAILVCAFFLLAAFIMMFIDREKEAVRRGFIKSIPILCSYLFVGMAYGMGVLG